MNDARQKPPPESEKNGADTVKPCVFIHTNEKQMLGALVSRYSLRRNSAHADRFDIRFIAHACRSYQMLRFQLRQQ